MSKLTLHDCVMRCLRDFQPWTFWDLQREIQQGVGKLYGEPSISAAIRDLRKVDYRLKFNLPLMDPVVVKERIPNARGYRYRLHPNVLKHWKERELA